MKESDIEAIVAERDSLRRRIDAVMDVHLMNLGDMSTRKDANFVDGYNDALKEVRAILAPKQEARFTVDNYCRAWRVMEGQQIIVEFSAWCPDAEKLARECCDRLNNGAGDE